MTYCLAIPHYNHARLLAKLLPRLVEKSYFCIVVDDGSDKEQLSLLLETIEKYKNNVHLVSHTYNRGKGAAVITASYIARTLGYSHLIQIDADGQHEINDIETFINFSKTSPETIISGKPVFDESVPKIRLYGRKVTDFWVAIETLSFKIKDSLCGFRVYPLNSFEKLLDHFYIGARMDFDTDVLVKAVWLDIPIHFIDTKVIYPEDGVSHFNYLRDNKLLIKLHTRLMLGVLVRSPFLIAKRFQKLFGQ